MHAALTAPRAIFDTSMLSGLTTLFDMLHGRATGKQMEAFMARTAATVVVPNALNQVDRIFNPRVRESDGPLGAAGAAVPFVRRSGSLQADILGEPIRRSPLDRFGGLETNDPLRTVLRAKNVAIPMAGSSTKLGDETMSEAIF